jgi:flagellar assembly protein FliH
MAQPARYLFDLDLGEELGHVIRHVQPDAEEIAPPPVPSIPEDLVAQLIADAKQEAFAEGVAQGERNAADTAAQTLAALGTTLATQVGLYAQALDEAILRHQSDAATLALAVGKKLALHLIARYPTIELEALIAECLEGLGEVPHLVVRCHPEMADAIRESATQHVNTTGFAGRLLIMGDEDIRLGDGRMEWVNGGVVRDIAATSSQMDRQISDYLAARQRNPNAKENG